MAAILGRLAELWAVTGSATSMTNQACTQVGATTTYYITNAAMRQWDYATAVTVKDGGATVDPSLYTLQMPIGRVVFTSPPSGAVTVTGKYWTMAQVGQVTSWKLDLKTDVFETTALGDTQRSFMSTGLIAWSGSFDLFHAASDNTWATYAATNTLPFYLKLYEDEPSDKVWIGLVAVDSWTQTTDVGDLVRESVSFSGAQDPFYVTSEA